MRNRREFVRIPGMFMKFVYYRVQRWRLPCIAGSRRDVLMKNKLRIWMVGLTVVLIVAALASGALLAQGDTRITPLDSPIALFCGGNGGHSLSAYRFDKGGSTHFAWTIDVSNPVVPVVATAEATAAPGATAIITT